MTFDTKIALVVREDLAMWQKLNVTAFLTSGLVGAVPGLLGEPYDAANRAVVKRYEPDAMQVVGLALREDKKAVDKITKGARMHS